MLQPAEHATVVVRAVVLVDHLHLLVHADLELLEFPQQLHRDDKLAKRVLLAREVSEVVRLFCLDHVYCLVDLLNLDPMFNFGALDGVSFEIQNERFTLTFIIRAVVNRQDIRVRRSLTLT